MTRIFTTLAVVSLILVGCTQPVANDNPSGVQDSQPATALDVTADDSISQPEITPGQDNPEVQYSEYQNKALGYRLKYPSSWYWRHYIKNQLGNSLPDIQDLFIANPTPLADLNAEILGRLVVAVSDKNLEELTIGLSDLAKTETQAAGQPARRYEGLKPGNLKTIEYYFNNGDKFYRIVYNKVDSSAVDEQVMTELIKDFGFVN
ncbi:MAG: hypothetical protein RB292_02100 [Patescibacteria group bacterium]|jgi:hypothetical protein|nr:hypothetical protein [Patescibacteria group bacterium]